MADTSAGASGSAPPSAPHGDASDTAPDAAAVFPGAGEMAARCRAFDWAGTPLGPVAGWSQSLRATVRLLLASRHPMFLWWGPDLVQLYNDAYRPSLGAGARAARALGARAADFWTEIWPVIGPQIAGVMTRGEPTWHEDALVPIERNGRLEDVYWTYGYSPAFDDDGTVGGTLVVCTETTARVRATAEREQLITAERRARADADAARAALARIFDQAPVAIAVLRGRELRYAEANPRYRQIIGARDPVGQRMVELFPELAGSEIEGVLERVHDSGVPFVANDLLIRFDSQGTGAIDNYYDLVYHPTAAEAGAPRDIVVLAVDVTERRRSLRERERLLEAAERARAEAEAANRAKGEFLAVMSHELRTPLNAIGGYVQLLEMELHGPVTDAQRTALARVQRAQHRLLGLVNDVLNYAKLEGGRVAYDVRAVDVGAVIADVAPLVEPQLTAKGLAFDVALPDGPCVVWADREKLGQVLLNLLANAAKFTPARHPASGAPGRVTVDLGTRAAGDAVFVRVTDTGRGVPRAKQEAIFDPFVQVQTGYAQGTEGTGLGLAISRDLARGMGGDLRVRSVEGEGATFTVTLRRAVALDTPTHPRDALPDSAPG